MQAPLYLLGRDTVGVEAFRFGLRCSARLGLYVAYSHKGTQVPHLSEYRERLLAQHRSTPKPPNLPKETLGLKAESNMDGEGGLEGLRYLWNNILERLQGQSRSISDRDCNHPSSTTIQYVTIVYGTIYHILFCYIIL